jgi:glycerophosphoryl diester phosphodiesterase
VNPLISFDPGVRLVIGHRGAAARFPENTFASFDHAVNLGVDAIEFDLRLSRDGVAVVMHDPTVDRTTSGSGAVAEMSASELARLDSGARFSPDGKARAFMGTGLTVPTLEGMLERYTGIPLLIELKVAAVAEEALRLFRRHGCEERVLVDAFDSAALRPFLGTKVAIGAAKWDVVSLMWRSAVRLFPSSLPYRGLCIPESYSGISVPVPQLARAAGMCGVPTHVWTVNDPNDARRLWSSGVTGIISDDPGTMLDVRRSLSQAAK